MILRNVSDLSARGSELPHYSFHSVPMILNCHHLSTLIYGHFDYFHSKFSSQIVRVIRDRCAHYGLPWSCTYRLTKSMNDLQVAN